MEIRIKLLLPVANEKFINEEGNEKESKKQPFVCLAQANIVYLLFFSLPMPTECRKHSLDSA